MSPPRALLRDRPGLAALLILAALLLRLMVPSGFMPVVQGDRWMIGLCSSAGAGHVAIAIPGMEHKSGGDDAAAGKGCAFADLSLVSLAGADPIQLAALIAFVMAIGAAARPASPRASPLRLRPPLRGPPLPF